MNNINENNKVIAEFLGYEVNYNKCYSPKYNDGTIAPMQFHKSWDWLIPVIQKCIKNIPQNCFTYDRVCSQDISFAYKSVIQFIKNQNK